MNGQPPATRRSYDVFISYSTHHRAWVEVLAQNLQATSYRVFLDTWELVPGRNWLPQLDAALDCARAGILVVSAETSASGWAQEEYQRMLRRRLDDPRFRIVPVVLGEAPELPFVGNVQAVSFRGLEDYRLAFYRLLCGLEDRAPGPNPDLSRVAHITVPQRPDAKRFAAASRSLPAEGTHPADERIDTGVEAFVASALDRLPGSGCLMLLGQADGATSTVRRQHADPRPRLGAPSQ